MVDTVAASAGAMLIDTHCHLDEVHFPEGPQAVLERARQAAIGHLIVIGVGQGTSGAEAAIDLAERNVDVSATVGWHPHDAADLSDQRFDEIEALARAAQVVAIGETGLDYHYLHSPAELQREAFRRMIGLARRVKLPLVIHTREARQDTLDILAQEGAADVGGVIHCFSEDRVFAARALDLGFDLSFSGLVTFRSAAAVHDTAKWVPSGRFMVETDSPYLSPVPLRRRRNGPANVVHTARAVAELRGEPIAELYQHTSAAAMRRFALEPLGA